MTPATHNEAPVATAVDRAGAVRLKAAYLVAGAGDWFRQRPGQGRGRLLEQQLATATDPALREQLESFRGQVVCLACGGNRLRPEALGVRLKGQNIAEVCRLSIGEAGKFFAAMEFGGDDLAIARPILREIEARLQFLQNVGLDYLTLDRASDTLSCVPPGP